MSHKMSTLSDLGRTNDLELHLAIPFFLSRLLSFSAYFNNFIYRHPCTFISEIQQMWRQGPAPAFTGRRKSNPSNPMHKYRLGVESSSAGKDLGVPVDNKLSTSPAVPLWLWRPVLSWGALGRVLAVGWGRWCTGNSTWIHMQIYGFAHRCVQVHVYKHAIDYKNIGIVIFMGILVFWKKFSIHFE